MIKKLYNRFLRNTAIRLFGRRLISQDGVLVKRAAVTDLSYRWENKPEVIELIVRTVKNGDKVVEVGSGWGTFAVTAGRVADRVVSYDGSATQIERARETAKLNDVKDVTEFIHATVGLNADLHDHDAHGLQISPSELPVCDVLILDCEGSERQIIEGLEKSPPNIIIETHPELGFPTRDIEELLVEHGYTVTKKIQMGNEKHALLAEK